ncbi:hypothetical protein [Pseudomonas sp. L13]|uniref:hypothetical protein n=1 Tax=Pseudomonas sp. L13 TaxID=343985 RepID=UPI00137B1133|nr:hypothetical protein [Pseudomonas sp. L13]
MSQLEPEQWARQWEAAQREVISFLKGLGPSVIVCTDAPQWDWPFFCQLAVAGRQWSGNVIARSLSLFELASDVGASQHHALTDARALLERWQSQERIDQRYVHQ